MKYFLADDIPLSFPLGFFFHEQKFTQLDKLSGPALIWKDGRLGYRNDWTDENWRPLSLDWSAKIRYHRAQNYSLSKEPLAKAIGIKGGQDLDILDATCGAGNDTCLLLHFKQRVSAFERSPILYALQIDARERLIGDFPEYLDYLDHRFIDSRTFDFEYDVIYLDPMYPETEHQDRKAQNKKEMRIFREIVGADEDADELLGWALKHAKQRVVMKRSKNTPQYRPEMVTSTYGSKSTHYDMFRIHR